MKATKILMDAVVHGRLPGVKARNTTLRCPTESCQNEAEHKTFDFYTLDGVTKVHKRALELNYLDQSAFVYDTVGGGFAFSSDFNSDLFGDTRDAVTQAKRWCAELDNLDTESI